MKEDGVKKNNETKEGGAWWQPSLILFARFSSWVALPILLFAFLGKFLDERYNSEPIFFLSLIGFSFFISIFGLVKEVKKEYKKIEDLEKNKNNKKTS
jgi:predicted permease